MTRKTALLTVCLAMAVRSAFAGVDRWTATGPEGGTITQIVVDPSKPTTLYAGTDRGGVFRSDDAGSTWHPTALGIDGTVQGLAISVTVPDVLYAAWDHFVYKTTDRGNHWAFVGAFETGLVTLVVSGLAVDPTNPNVVWVAATGGYHFSRGTLYRSDDGGVHWTAVLGSPASTGFVVVDPRNEPAVYAAINGLQRTTDGGVTWTDVSGGLDFRTLAFPHGASGLVFGGTSNSGVFVSLDRGDHWVPANGGLSGNALKILDLAAVPGEPASLYAATEGGLYRTDNNGTSWQFASAGPRPILRATSNTTLYAKDELGVVRSLDGGNAWQPANHGMVATSVRSMAATESAVLAAAGASVYRSTDAGESWNVSLTTPFPATPNVLGAGPSNSAAFYVGLCSSSTLLSRSLDSGQTWAPFDDGLEGDCVLGFGAQQAPDGYLFAGLSGHLYRRRAGENAWKEVSTITARAFFSDPARPDLVWAGADQGFFRSDDGGATWSPAGLEKPIYAIVGDPTDPDTLYVGGTNYSYGFEESLYKSIDGGVTWTFSGNGLPSYQILSLAIDSTSPDSIYAATPFGVYHSVNGGLGWSQFNNGLRLQDFVAGAATSLVFEPSQRRLLAGTSDTGVGSWDLTQDRRLGAAASLHGGGGTFFHSDVAVLNMSPDHDATIQPLYHCFSPPCGTPTGTFTLAPRQAASFIDIVGNLFAAPQSGGAVEFQTDDPIALTSRLYTPSIPAPTLGMFVPGLDPAQASSTQVLLLLSHSADPVAGSRTNVGVWNPNDEGLDVTFRFFTPDGAELGSLVRHLDALGALQVNDSEVFEALGLSGDVDSFYAVIEGDGIAPVQSYAAVIDNLSQDPFFVFGQPGARVRRGDFSAHNRVTVPAVASLHGHAGTFFHSDLSIWNASDFPNEIVIRYRCSPATCPSASQTITLQPGEMRAYPDVVAGLLASPETGGALELEGNRPLVAESRLYTPAHSAPTLGMFVPGLGPAYATPAALLTSLSSSADLSKGFRTNIGVFNASDEAHVVTVTLFDVDGHSLGSISWTVEAHSPSQINDVFRTVGIFTDVPQAYASVRSAGANALYAYAAVIDNQSQDPIFIPGHNDPNPPPQP